MLERTKVNGNETIDWDFLSVREGTHARKILSNFLTAGQKIRSELKAVEEIKALSNTTAKNYVQKFKTMSGGKPSELAATKKSFYTLRAAFLCEESKAIRKKLNELDGILKDLQATEKRGQFKEAWWLCERIRDLNLQSAITKFMAIKAERFDESKEAKQPNHCKRATGKLPGGWKGQLVGHVPKDSQYRTHVALMALCGCRPSEFETGIAVKQKDDDTFVIVINGTKTGTRSKDGKTYTTGQSQRTLILNRGDTLDAKGFVNTEFLMLERALKGNRGAIKLKAKATAIRDVVIRASEKAFPDLVNKPTAYSFRHDFASQLKAANGEGSIQTAAALGHASTKTQGCYGYGRSGGSGGVICRQAAASDPIRCPKTSRQQRLSKVKRLKI